MPPAQQAPESWELHIDRYLNDFTYRRQVEEKARGEPISKEELDFAARRFKAVDFGIARSRLQRARTALPLPSDDVT